MEMELKSLITELTQGKKLALQLRAHLQPSSSSSPEEPCFFLTEMIQSSFEKALLLLNLNSSNSIMPDPTTHKIALGKEKEEEPRKNKGKNSRDVLKRRKLLPKWTEEIKICSGTAPEKGPLNDGYSWRKYGQKDIHGANFPRCYYRCSHRHERGCLATKQVQRSDNDPNIFDVTYRGRHTCNQSTYNLGLVSGSAQIEISEDQETDQNQQRNPNSEFWFNFGVESEDSDDIFPPISFLSSSMMDLPFIADGGLSAAPVSSATSEETAWDWSAYHGGGIQMVQSSEQSDIVSATTSVTDSPICNEDWDFDFDQSFPFDSLDIISS